MTAPGANGYDYTVAKNVLTDTEKDRFLACYLNLNDSNAINWEKAASDFGSASVASFKKMIQTACKKVTDAQNNGGELPTPSKGKAAASGGKKRKASTPADGGEGDETPVPKKGRGGGRKKKVDTPVDDDEEAGGQRPVKKEAEDEDEF